MQVVLRAQYSLRHFHSFNKARDSNDYWRESFEIARPVASLGRLGAPARGLPRGRKLLGEHDGILGAGARNSRGLTSSCMLVLCGSVLVRFRLMTLEEELSVSMQSFTFGCRLWKMEMVCGIEYWRFVGCCKPPEIPEGGQGIGENFDGWIEQIFLDRFLGGS